MATKKNVTKAEMQKIMDDLEKLNKDLKKRIADLENQAQVWARDVDAVKVERNDLQNKLDSAVVTKQVSYGVGIVGVLALVAALFV